MNLITGLGTSEEAPPPDAVAVVCLETLLRGAELLGATVVAAAGNESSPQGAVPAEAPAAYDSVIGVSASNKDQKRSCFSNKGDVAAPGGDTYESSTDQCIGALAAEAEDVVVGLAPHTSPASGYARWVGTSFSAPLVSGLAALMLEHPDVAPTLDSINVKNPQPPPPAPPSPLGKGIIDIRANLPEP
jgi:subtilisin family serine protease